MDKRRKSRRWQQAPYQFKPRPGLSRRDLINLGIMSGAATLIGKRAWGAGCIDQTPIPIDQAINSCGVIEVFPTSPFILQPFIDPLPILTALRPGYRAPDLFAPLAPNDSNQWSVRVKGGTTQTVNSPPSPASGDQDALGARPREIQDNLGGPVISLPDAGTHQLWPGQLGTPLQNYPDPRQSGLLYHIRLQVSQHSFTSSPVQPIDSAGNNIAPPPSSPAVKNKKGYILPQSTIYGFNGTFPGPMINVEYGMPVNVRFQNDLDLNPLCLDRQDFGAPDWAFLTHLHNGHTAPESDGQPNHMFDHDGGYQPGEWCDNLYNNYPAGGDEAEKQSFLWFHDHRMHHTGANVYKGMVGIAPHYDPVLDPGDETEAGLFGTALHLPGRKVSHSDGTFDVKYDIPLALYDVAFDDGVTPHADFHNGCGQLHPEWWGKSYFRHFPNHGFVGDVFTVNGVAYPVMHVLQRKYRFRFLDCSVSRIYQLWLMSSKNGPKAAPGTKGQWQLPDGQQRMKFTQIASEGGLLPHPIPRNSFELWPAKRREFVVDFTQYMDGHATRKGDVLYLVNSLSMSTGREPDNFPADPNVPGNYLVPILKIVIDGPTPANEPDLSVVPNNLRPMPIISSSINANTPADRTFTLQRGSPANNTLLGSAETQWVINSLQFDPVHSLALPRQGVPEVWTTQNGGGGWVHPMHMHMEEHRVLRRNGVPAPDVLHPDDTGREDVAALYPSEGVTFYRNFRTYFGRYVAHCHNLAHEDHNMMFGWAIVP